MPAFRSTSLGNVSDMLRPHAPAEVREFGRGPGDAHTCIARRQSDCCRARGVRCLGSRASGAARRLNMLLAERRQRRHLDVLDDRLRLIMRVERFLVR